ncbi:50S ribosomal protein L25/general stress protein Ctc [Alkanindiges hydrocarboniclasticus]|jgi:large subunit ribosomal protein L25|uniref:Large ribosomal subunit protein bL25 n=1 Tax=Alkanindiges hydrocarboniclasticus TaxID=1907941 RepID=A0A1S8CTY0_9GAMM|nr:50S ribosomal protein L25/general stress protein Ctc [Alkanindiges hydrocarboniclasticus]ONG39137.1 50S ribosomal protein L25/general stress protein Ctc [Alkanindiges hydrocarboniclasticus]
MTDFNLNAVARDQQGKGASRRLRHANLVPAVIYGGEQAPQSISITFKELVKVLESEAFYSHIVNLNVDGQVQPVVLKALQRHPAKNFPMHADFLRVDATHTINVRVPLHFINQESAVGVKQQGGIVSIIANDVEIITLPGNLPEFIEVDLAEVEVGTVVHLSDIKLPEGVKIAALEQGASHNNAIANIHAPAGGASQDSAE